MKAEVKDVSPVVKQLEVTISADSIGNEIDKFYFDLRKTAKIKGFRPGKVPRAVLEKFYKKQVEGEVISKLISDSYEAAIKEKNILPVSPPIIDTPKFASEKDFTYTSRRWCSGAPRRPGGAGICICPPSTGFCEMPLQWTFIS